MRLDWPFRVSLYLTLAVASLCLATAEELLLPGTLLFVVPVLVLLGVAFLVEGRWALPVWAANLLGVAIAAGWGTWLLQQLFDDTDPLRGTIPLTAAMLPYLGPLLMLLVVGQLFRPKQRRDVWALEGVGLLQVGLGCVLAYTPYFGGLLFVYVVCALTSLALFELRGGNFLGDPGGLPAPALPGRPAAGGRPAAVLPRPLRWAVGTTTAALVLCLVLPRGGAEAWNPLRLLSAGNRPSVAAPAATGASDQIDLNRTGWVEVDDEVALVVSAEDASHQPKLDLSPGQRWRGPVLDRYRDGRWEGGVLQPIIPSLGDTPPDPGASLRIQPPELIAEVGTTQRPLFDLGPRQYFLTFELQPVRAGGVFLAEPIVLRGPAGKLREAGVTLLRSRSPGLPLFFEFEGTLVPASRTRPGLVVYRQVTVPPDEPDLSPPAIVQGAYAQALTQQPVTGLTEWTRQLAERVASRPEWGIRPEDLRLKPAASARLQADHPAGVLPPENWEKVARALEGYLAHSGEYTYTLDLRRADPDLDPTLDFLSNVKAGHCNRYAGGLTLMLRALGIPARIVMGFRGCDGRGDGTYEVRNSQAHAWVEVPVRPRPGPNGTTEWQWLALDPTPEGEAARPPWFSVGRWWERGQSLGQLLWRSFVVDYNAEQQEQLWQGLGGSLQAPGGLRLPSPAWLLGLGLLPAAVAGLWLARRARPRRRPAPPASPVAFYRRFLVILAHRRGLRPAASQTPREFAEVARPALATLPAELASLPAEVAELLYRVRYGAEVLPDTAGRALDLRLGQLDAALAGH